MAKKTEQPLINPLDATDIPSSKRLKDVIASRPQIPDDWRNLGKFFEELYTWHTELVIASTDVMKAANGATELMAQVFDGRRPVNSDSARMLAEVIAIRS